MLTVSAATLTSIAVSPANPTIAAGTDQQFTATGTYSDASSADLTSSVTWASATPATATIGATTGLAHGVSPGTSTISATLGAVSGSTVLTVSRGSGHQGQNQTIKFGAIPTKTLAQSPLTVHPTASSGLAVTLSSTTLPVCTVSGTTITSSPSGPARSRPTRPATRIYNPAPTITRSFKGQQGQPDDHLRPTPAPRPWPSRR